MSDSPVPLSAFPTSSAYYLVSTFQGGEVSEMGKRKVHIFGNIGKNGTLQQNKSDGVT
jgi:hypothetical protein